MNRKALSLCVVVLSTVIAVPLVPSAPAQEPPATPSDAGPENGDEPVIREQSIYIPYEKLRGVFEKEGRGVFLPYERFRELWEAAREKTRPPAEPEPPVGALITEVDNEAVAEKDVVRVKAVVKIEVIAKGWTAVPLRLADAAITQATLGDGPARIVPDGDSGYKLLIEKKGEEPEQIELKLEYAKAITRSPGRNSVSFQAPQAPVSRWTVRIPEPGVKVDLHPLIAATEVPVVPEGEAPPAVPPPEPDETVVLAFVGAAPTVRIEWTPKAEGAAGMEALASVQVEQQTSIREGLTRTSARLAYTVSRAELASLTIEVPGNQKVVNVFDANVRQWSVEQADERQQITVQLFEPAKGSQNVVVELEQFADEEAPEQEQRQIEVPVVKAVGVGRQLGVVVVQVAEGLRAETTEVSGLLQLDAAELPQTLARGQWTFSYRYAAVPFQLRLSLEKIEPRISADSLVEAWLEDKTLSLDMLVIYTVERAGVFRLELDVPAGFEVVDVRGREAAGAAAAGRDTYHLEGDDRTRLVVNLSRKALGRVGLFVELEKRLDQPELLVPGGKAELPLPIPQVAPGSVERATGRLIVYAAENLLVNPVEEEPKGFRAIATAAALEGMEPAPGRDPKFGPVKAYAYTQERGELVLRAERRRPQVRVRQLLVAEIEEGSVTYRAKFFYDVLYSSVKSLRIDVPADVSGELRNRTESMQESQITPAPDDVPKGYVAWSFAGATDLLGEHELELEWKRQLDRQVGSDEPVRIVLPHLKPVGADLPWGQIVLTKAKAETIDLRETGETTGLRPIDPQHDLMPDADVPDAAAAYQFDGDWSLTIAATRYELEEIQTTSVERAVVRMVVTRANKVAVQALYRMRSARQRLAVRLPAGSQFDADPQIDGRRVSLELEEGRTDENEYLVPLIRQEGRDADDPFLLELRYTVPCQGRRFRLDRPVFPLEEEPAEDSAAGEAAPSEAAAQGPAPGGVAEPAMQQVYFCVYLPEELDLVGKRGPWTDHFRWDLSETLDFQPRAEPNDRELLRWVAPERNLSESFRTDGRLYVFSALRPAPPPEGSLYLVARDADWLSACVIGLAVILGVILIPFGAGRRVLVVGVLVIGMVVLGVFNPILARQVCDGALLSACLIVLVVWVVWYFVWTLPRARARQKAGEAGPPPGPAPEPAIPMSPFGGPSGSQQPQPPPEPAAAPPGASTPSPEVVVIEEPRAKDASPGADRDKGGQSDA